MTRSLQLLSLTALLLGSSGIAADKPRLDAHGDLLPDGARARLGTIKFRGAFEGVTLSPDGKAIAVCDDQSLRLLDAVSGLTLQTFRRELSTSPLAVAFSPDGKVLASLVHPSSPNGGIELWSVPTGKSLGTIDLAGANVSTLAFSAEGRLLTVGGHQLVGKHNAMPVWDVATRKQVAAVVPMQKQSVSAALSGDGKRVATWGHAGGNVVNLEVLQRHTRTIQVWDTGNSREIKKLEMPLGTAVEKASLSRDGRRLVVCTGSLLTIWDVTTGKLINEFTGRRKTLSCFLSPDEKTLVSVSSPLAVQLWDVEAGERRELYKLPDGADHDEPWQVVFTPAGRLLACSSTGNAVHLWDLKAGKRLTPLHGHDWAVTGLGFVDGGQTLYSISEEGGFCRWDVATGQERKRSWLRDADGGRGQQYGRRLLAALVAPDGRHLLSFDSYSAPLLWDLAAEREMATLAWQWNTPDRDAQFSADGTYAVLGGQTRPGKGGVVTVCAVSTGRRVKELLGAFEVVLAVAFAPDGKTVAALSGEGQANPQQEVRAWDVSTGKTRWSRSTSEVGFSRLAFSPDGAMLALGGPEGGLTLWHAATGEEQRRLVARGEGDASALLFSPDGRTLAQVTSDEDREASQVNVWEVATGSLRKRLTGHLAEIVCVAFTPDGATLATGSRDTTVLLWDLTGRLGQEKPKEPPGDKELAGLWASLDVRDAKTAHPAMAKLQLSPTEAVALFAKHLSPVKAVTIDPATIPGLVADLNHSRFQRREKARRELETLGKAAESELRKGLEDKPTVEMRRRIEDLLAKLDKVEVKPEWVRPLRAYEVLERIGTPEARKLLETLASGAPEARLTQEAKTVLRRLNASR